MQHSIEEGQFRRLKLLGEGSSGKAFLAECATNKQLCVVKQINLALLNREEREIARKQATILSKLKHPYIIEFKKVFQTKAEKLVLVMEYAAKGDLHSRIEQQAKSATKFPEETVLDWLTQISLALKHVHDRKIIHRDIKGQNIFLTAEDRCKLGDFGISKALNSTYQKAKTVVGTPYFLSPEIVQSKPYSLASDIWSLGVLTYEMCMLMPPFQGNSLQTLAIKIVEGKFTALSSLYSQSLSELISAMLKRNPASRPTVNQILNHSLIRERVSKFLSQQLISVQFSHTILHNRKLIPSAQDIGIIERREQILPDNSFLFEGDQPQVEEQSRKQINSDIFQEESFHPKQTPTFIVKKQDFPLSSPKSVQSSRKQPLEQIKMQKKGKNFVPDIKGVSQALQVSRKPSNLVNNIANKAKNIMGTPKPPNTSEVSVRSQKRQAEEKLQPIYFSNLTQNKAVKASAFSKKPVQTKSSRITNNYIAKKNQPLPKIKQSQRKRSNSRQKPKSKSASNRKPAVVQKEVKQPKRVTPTALKFQPKINKQQIKKRVNSKGNQLSRAKSVEAITRMDKLQSKRSEQDQLILMMEQISKQNRLNNIKDQASLFQYTVTLDKRIDNKNKETRLQAPGPKIPVQVKELLGQCELVARQEQERDKNIRRVVELAKGKQLLWQQVKGVQAKFELVGHCQLQRFRAQLQSRLGLDTFMQVYRTVQPLLAQVGLNAYADALLRQIQVEGMLPWPISSQQLVEVLALAVSEQQHLDRNF